MGKPIKPAVQIGTDVHVELRDGRHIIIQTDPGSNPTAPTNGQPDTTTPGDHANSPAPTAAPKQTFSGFLAGVLNFVTLSARFAALAAAAVLLKEGLHLLKARMHRDAAFARKVAELCGQAGVDAYFQGLFIETSQAFDRVAEASGELSDAADQMEANARDVKDAHDSEYGGIYEVAQVSPYDQPKPGFNRVR